MLADDPQFIPIIQQTWATDIRGCAMYRVWKKLSCCKYALKTLSKARYNSIDKRVEEARDNLAEHQGNHEVQDNQSFYIEKVLREELEK